MFGLLLPPSLREVAAGKSSGVCRQRRDRSSRFHKTGTGVTASAASACASRSLICERRTFPPLHPVIAHRLVLAGIGIDLRAVQPHPATFNARASSAIFRTCSKSPSIVFKWILPEIGYGAEVRLIIRRQHPEGDIFHQSPFWLVRIAAAEVWAVVQSHPCRDEAASWMGHPQLRWCWLRKSWGGPPARACSSYRPPVCAHAAS